MDDRGQNGWMASLTHGHKFKQVLGDGEGQGSLVCCSPWGHKESDTTEQLNNNSMSIESMMLSNYLILCRPLLLLPSIISRHQSFQ